MPANFATFAHFSVSSAMKFPNTTGGSAITVEPRSGQSSFDLGIARAALISLLSLSTIFGNLSCQPFLIRARLGANQQCF
jgi:hypothetical protein